MHMFENLMWQVLRKHFWELNAPLWSSPTEFMHEHLKFWDFLEPLLSSVFDLFREIRGDVLIFLWGSLGQRLYTF